MPSSYQEQRSHLLLLPAVEYRRRLGEESVCDCCVQLLLDWTPPCLVSPCDPTSVFLIFTDHLGVHGKAGAEFASQSKSRQQSAFFE